MRLKVGKNVVSMLVALTLIFASALAANAENVNSQSSLDTQLVQKGYPQEVLDNLIDPIKEELLNSAGQFEGADIRNFHYKDGTLEELPNTISYQGNVRTQNPVLRGTLPTTDLSLVTLYAGLDKTADGKKRYRLTANWSWKKLPLVVETDKMAIWYNDQFETDVQTNGGYGCQHYNGSSYTSCGGTPSDISSSGAAWNFKLGALSLNSGGCWLNVQAKSVTSGSTTAVFVGKYAHNYFANTQIGVSFGVTSVTFSGSFDEAATQTSWYM